MSVVKCGKWRQGWTALVWKVAGGERDTWLEAGDGSTSPAATPSSSTESDAMQNSWSTPLTSTACWIKSSYKRHFQRCLCFLPINDMFQNIIYQKYTKRAITNNTAPTVFIEMKNLNWHKNSINRYNRSLLMWSLRARPKVISLTVSIKRLLLNQGSIL